MSDMHLGVVESRFADLIWANEPISTQELTRLCEQKLGWKRTTTYTVLKRLSERGLFRNDGGQVSSLVSRDAFYGHRSCQFIEESFGGSLPAFLAAFASHRSLTEDEVAQIRRLIEEV